MGLALCVWPAISACRGEKQKLRELPRRGADQTVAVGSKTRRGC